MDGIFIIIVAIPTIAILSIIIAIVWGFTKSKNSKKYFLILFGIIVAIAFFISTFFYDYKSTIVNTFSNIKVPAQYSKYPYLSDTVTAKYAITVLDGSISEIFTDSLTHNLIVITKTKDELFCHRIDSLGRVLGSFTYPNYINQYGHYWLSPSGYYNWITTGDSICKAYTKIPNELTRETFSPWYNKADYVQFYSDSTCIFHMDDVWYSCQLDFNPKPYSSYGSPYKDKSDSTNTYLMERLIDIPFLEPTQYNSGAYEQALLIFKKYPKTDSSGILSFEYFGKDYYDSGFSHFFSGMFSLNGDSYHSEKWYGVAYCKLKIGKQYIPFNYNMEHILGDYDRYEMNLSIYISPSYAILAGVYNTYIISISN